MPLAVSDELKMRLPFACRRLQGLNSKASSPGWAALIRTRCSLNRFFQPVNDRGRTNGFSYSSSYFLRLGSHPGDVSRSQDRLFAREGTAGTVVRADKGQYGPSKNARHSINLRIPFRGWIHARGAQLLTSLP